jgi:X-Pro dipeptidyl-peptidase
VTRVALALAAAAALSLPAVAGAGSAPDLGRAFEPAPKSMALYGVKAPSADPTRQQHTVQGVDGTDLYVETWLPAAKNGHTPPARVPTVLVMTPYVQQGEERYPGRNSSPMIEWFVSRGYAVAQHHVRGTGQSGGCIEQTSTLQIDDGARVVEYLGRDAPWTNGNVGMYGISYDAETQISVAGRGDPNRTKYLKAIVPAETVGGQYEYSNFDGVPYAGAALLSNAAYLATTSLNPGAAPIDAHTFERFGCQPEMVAGSIDYSGDLTPFWQVREYRPQAGNITAATLWLHGLSDWNVDPITVAGFFDRLPAATPHKGIFGFWEHNYPDKHAGVSPDWERTDFLPLVTAWYDRWLKDLDTGVDAWPPVQVQGSDGQWRAEPDWPRSGGPVGQLALGPEGTLGVANPTGSTSYVEGPDEEDTIPGTRAVFTTPALAAPLHLTGQPILDAWLTTSTGDGHVVARLQVLGADGSVVTLDGSNVQEIATYGMRSLRHLEPMPNGYFVQQHGQSAPIETPIRVPLRFHPNDLVVPRGGRLRLTVAGMLSGPDQTTPSGTVAQITLLHDCEHPSALRFLEARPDGPLVNVREADERGRTLASTAAVTGGVDAGGLASAPVCGKPPERLSLFGTDTSFSWPTRCTGVAPRVRRVRLARRSVLVSGTTATPTCAVTAAARRVRVSIGLRGAKGRCRFLSSRGRLGRSRRCSKPVFLRAKGSRSWKLSLKRARLPRGRYLVRVKAGTRTTTRRARVR